MLTEWMKVKGAKVLAIKFLPNKYDLRGDVLVQFNGGKVYRYRDVPEIVITKFMYSKDPDEYFKTYVRPYYKLEKENVSAQS